MADIDSTDCLWSLPILEFSEGPNYSGTHKLHDTIQDDLYSVTRLVGGEGGYSPRHIWKENAPRDERIWNFVSIGYYCPELSSDSGDSIERARVGLLGDFRHTLGWGLIEADDQAVADIFGAQQVIQLPSPASGPLEKVKDLYCIKQQKDSYNDIVKSILENLIALGVAYATGGVGGPLLSLVIQVSLSMFILPRPITTFSENFG